MAVLATTVLSDAGTKPPVIAPSASDTVEIGSGKDTFLVVRNTDTAAHTVTITPSGSTSYGVALPVKTVSTPATAAGEVWIPLRQDYANADGNGRATVAISNFATTTISVVRVG